MASTKLTIQHRLPITTQLHRRRQGGGGGGGGGGADGPGLPPNQNTTNDKKLYQHSLALFSCSFFQ